MTRTHAMTDQELAPQPSRLLKSREVCERTSMSSKAINDLWKKGLFPEPILIANGGNGAPYLWLESEVEEFIQDRAKQARVSRVRGFRL